MASTGITADGPITMMSSDGLEIVIPLSALYVGDDGAVKTDRWPGFAHFKNDQAVITAWLQSLLTAGTIGPVPPPQPQPAMLVRAAAAGADGNTIAVNVANVGTDADPTKNTFDLSVVVTQTYPALTPATVETRLGSDLHPLPQPGLVDVVHDSIDVSKTAVAQTVAISGAGAAAKPQVSLVDAGMNAVVKLEANHRVGTTALQLTSISAAKKTFSLTATWSETAAKTYSGLSLTSIKATLDGDPVALVTVPVAPAGTKPPDATKHYVLSNAVPSVTVLGSDGNPAFDLHATSLTGDATVTFTTASADTAAGTFDMTVTQTGAAETEQFDAVSLDAIEALLGSDAAPLAAPKLVQVVHGSVTAGGVVAGPGAATFPAVASGGQPAQGAVKDNAAHTVFALEANQRDGTTSADIRNVAGNAFDMIVTWKQTATATTIATLTADAAKFGGVVAVLPPPGGAFTVPAANAPLGTTTPLTGGADGARASATLFTSTT